MVEHIINFIFIRHGESCQNLVHTLHRFSDNYNDLLIKYLDPDLTDSGVIDSINSGILLKSNLEKYDIKKIDFIGASTMFRAIKTAHYMTKDLYALKKIHVCPYLRESSSPNSVEQTNRQYPIKTIVEQNELLKLDNIQVTFKYVLEEKIRETPGNIKKFIDWFGNNIVNRKIEFKNRDLNVLVFLHSGIMSDFANGGFQNNTGFILQTKHSNAKITYTKEDLYMHKTDFKINRTKTKCPSSNCPGIC